VSERIECSRRQGSDTEIGRRGFAAQVGGA
jgi:hypothetical protein